MAQQKTKNKQVSSSQASNTHTSDKVVLRANNKITKYQKGIRADFLYAKIHRATVTDSNLNYIGSISLDSRLMKASGILEGMKVEIVNINNGERFSTYAIEANSCSKKSKNTQEEQMATVCLNGAAARKVQQGDIIIILAYANVKLKYAKKIKPKIVFVDSCNMITTTQE